MERYDEYKESGVEWIGEIPAGWSVRRIKDGYRIVPGATPRSGVEAYWGGDIPWITPADFDEMQHYVSGGSRNITKEGFDSCGTTLVPKNSIVVSNRAPIGLVALASNELCTNQGCKSLVPLHDETCSNYLYWYLCVQSETLNSFGRGTTFLELSSTALGNYCVPVPPIGEQRVIAAYLDGETARVDSIIADCEREVELLKECRKAVISEAVTKGLDPNAPMKDSGIEWIGEIPEGWKVVPFKIAARVVADLQDPQNYPDLFQVSPERIEKDTGKLLECKSVSEAGVESDNHLFHEGDILYSKVRPALNKVTIATFDGMCSADMYPIQTSFNHCWLKYYMLSDTFMKQVIVSTDRVKMPKLNKEELGRFKVVLPGNNEQRAIATYLDERTAEIDALVADYQSMAKKLREYRKSLISEAVAGKFKVPGLA